MRFDYEVSNLLCDFSFTKEIPSELLFLGQRGKIPKPTKQPKTPTLSTYFYFTVENRKNQTHSAIDSQLFFPQGLGLVLDKNMKNSVLNILE